jgi:hypothetical protein
MELVRYRPGDAVRWLKAGADTARRQAKRQGVSLIRREGERSIGKDVSQAAGALIQSGKSALAELLLKRAEATEYVLTEDAFEVAGAGVYRRIRYDEVSAMRLDGDRAVLVLSRGSHTIRPYAHIVAGRLRVPVGWTRNDIEVPYELLLEELAVRCGLEIEEA